MTAPRAVPDQITVTVPAMVPRPPGDGSGEPPQAIADDYPGWGVRHDNGTWTAWCPAVTVRAASAAGLRAAIEDVIAPDRDG